MEHHSFEAYKMAISDSQLGKMILPALSQKLDVSKYFCNGIFPLITHTQNNSGHNNLLLWQCEFLIQGQSHIKLALVMPTEHCSSSEHPDFLWHIQVPEEKAICFLLLNIFCFSFLAVWFCLGLSGLHTTPVKPLGSLPSRNLSQQWGEALLRIRIHKQTSYHF